MASTESNQVDPGSDQPARLASLDGVHVRRLAIFEDRYGVGSYERLLRWLQQPCLTFAEIAARLKVTRERVRQWHLLLMPGAPTGRERRRQCGLYRQRKRLLGDRVFGAFYRHVRRHFHGSRIALIRAKTGYRTGIVRVDGRLVAIREGSRRPSEGVKRAGASEARKWSLGRYRGRAEFVYFQLDREDFLVLPAALLPVHGTTYSDDRAGRYWPFKNTFDALRTEALPLAGQASWDAPPPGSHSVPPEEQRPEAGTTAK